eukprot:7064267-Prymnesium_polylepis.1
MEQREAARCGWSVRSMHSDGEGQSSGEQQLGHCPYNSVRQRQDQSGRPDRGTLKTRPPNTSPE